MRCVSPHVSPQVVEKFCPLVWEMGKRTWACAGAACPALPLLSPAGAWRFWLPVDFAAVVPEGVACLLCRLPILPLACFPAPYPPARARRALFPAGEGGAQGYFMRGAAPLASPWLNPGGTRAGVAYHALEERLAPALPARPAAAVSGWVACLLCRLPTLPLACFPAPYPPDPLPRRGRGRLKVYFAGGSAPGTPALNRLRHLQNPPSKCPAEESLLGVADCPRRRPRRVACPDVFLSMP